MNCKKIIIRLLMLSIPVIVISCQEPASKETAPSAKEETKAKPEERRAKLDLTKGKGSLSFKLDGQLYETDPQRTKCWTTTTIPLAMLMARGDGLSISWQMGYTENEKNYKLDGDKKGTINFTIGKKTYWTRRRGDNYLNIIITEIKDKYSVRLLSGTFEGVLEDKEGNKVQITEGKFVTSDI